MSCVTNFQETQDPLMSATDIGDLESDRNGYGAATSTGPLCGNDSWRIVAAANGSPGAAGRGRTAMETVKTPKMTVRTDTEREGRVDVYRKKRRTTSGRTAAADDSPHRRKYHLAVILRQGACRRHPALLPQAGHNHQQSKEGEDEAGVEESLADGPLPGYLFLHQLIVQEMVHFACPAASGEGRIPHFLRIFQVHQHVLLRSHYLKIGLGGEKEGRREPLAGQKSRRYELEDRARLVSQSGLTVG